MKVRTFHFKNFILIWSSDVGHSSKYWGLNSTTYSTVYNMYKLVNKRL
jgi:hypothetical protein